VLIIMSCSCSQLDGPPVVPSFPTRRSSDLSRPCLNGFMGICCAPCAGRVTQEEFSKNVEDAITFLKGGSVKAVKEMQAQMLELRSEEHTSELQSRFDLVCRLLLEKKNVLQW